MSSRCTPCADSPSLLIRSTSMLVCVLCLIGVSIHPARASAGLVAFNDLLRINEMMLLCVTDRVQFVELVSTGADQFFYSGTSLAVYGSDGGLLFDIQNIVPPSLDATPWAEGRTLLLGSTAFRVATGVVPDVDLPEQLDPVGGRVVLHHVNPFTNVEETIQELVYGAGSPVVAPPPGSSLQRDPSGGYEVSASPSPTKLSGVDVAIDCSGCAYQLCPASFWRVSFGPWTSVTSPVFSMNVTGHYASFDMGQGLATVGAAGYSNETALELHDVYSVEGLGESDTITFKARLTATLNGYRSCTPHGHCDEAYSDASLRYGNQVVATSLINGIETLEIVLRKGRCEQFELVQFLSAYATGFISGGSGATSTKLEFIDLPPGVRVSSCWGYVQDSPTPALISNVSAEASARAVALRWHTPDPGLAVNVYRRDGILEASSSGTASDWTLRGSIISDGTGMLAFEDPDVVAGGRYDYRLGLVQAGREIFVGQVSVEVPLASVLGIRFPGGHPARPGAEVEMSLPGPERARFDLYDVAGRRVGSREIRPDGSRTIRLRLDAVAALRPGVYLVELRQGVARTSRRMLVVQ